MAYASFNTGYKAGGYNTGGLCLVNVVGDCPAASIAPPVKPEKLTAYEVGFKSELFDRMVRFNVAGFYYDYRDLQVQSLANAGPGGGLIAILNNAAKARIKGVDVELVVAPTRFITLNGAFEVLDAKFKDFPGFVPSVPRTVAPYGNSNGPAINAAGNHLTRAPNFTGNIGATVTIPAKTGEFRINTNYAYNGGFYWEASNRVRQNAYGLLNAEIAYSPDDRWTVKLWGRNITATKYYSFVDATPFGDRGRVGAPVTYGASLNYKM
jgi:iron complex outermembrane receptor protein